MLWLLLKNDKDLIVYLLHKNCRTLDTVMKAKEMALAKGKTIIVDPAPAAAMPEEFWKDIDYIKPNETELGILIGRELHSKEEYKEAAHEMLKKGVKHLLVTLGSK